MADVFDWSNTSQIWVKGFFSFGNCHTQSAARSNSHSQVRSAHEFCVLCGPSHVETTSWCIGVETASFSHSGEVEGKAKC